MTARKPSADADDLADAPFLDEAERAESKWLIARENDPGAHPPSSRISNDYAELEDLLGNLPADLPDERWHDEVLRIASASASPPWWRRAVFKWSIGGAFVTAAAMALWLLIPRAPAEIEVAIRHGDAARGDPTRAARGDHLIVTARLRKSGDLRVFRSDGKLAASCPRGPGCSASADGEYTVETTLDAPVQYHVILVVGLVEAPLSGTMDAYMAAARTANARIVTRTIDVH